MSDIPPTPPAASTTPSEPAGTTPPPATAAPIDYLGGPPHGDFSWNDFLTFRTMIAVPTVMMLFWVGVVWCLIAGITMMVGHGFAGVCLGFATIIFGPFLVRLQCEFLIVVFRMNETLTDILNTLRGRPPRL